MTNSLRILNFHDIGEPVATTAAFTRYPQSLFRALMHTLRDNGWRTVPLASATASLLEGASLPPKSLALTFDDGYRSFLDIAFPVLLELEFTATLFVNTAEQRRGHLESLHGLPMLNWTQLREIHGSGFSIGSHGVEHVDLRVLSAQQLANQLQASKAALEEHLGSPIDMLAYPFGRHDSKVRDAAASCYRFAYSDRLAVATPGSPTHAVPRIDMAYFNRQVLTRLLRSPVLPAYLGLRRSAGTFSQSPGSRGMASEAGSG